MHCAWKSALQAGDNAYSDDKLVGAAGRLTQTEPCKWDSRRSHDSSKTRDSACSAGLYEKQSERKPTRSSKDLQ